MNSKLGQNKRYRSARNEKRRRGAHSRRRLTTESLESRVLLAGDTMAWHNAGLPLDTNDDGRITSLDALRVINDLNTNGSRDVVSDELASGYIDTNSDGVVSASDVLKVVNYLNKPQGEGDAKVQVRLVVTATDSLDPITSLSTNEDFLLRAFVTDLTAPAGGVFTAYVDVTYNADLADVNGDVIHAPEFPNDQSGDTSTDGLLDEVGSFSGSFTGQGDVEQLLFSVPMQTEDTAGTIAFNGNPPDILPTHEFLLFGEDEAVLGEEIMFVNTSLEVTSTDVVPPTANADVYDTVEDFPLTVDIAEGVLANDVSNGGALSATVLSNVENGTLFLNSNGSFTYTPNENYFGPDSFTYVASDGTLQSTPATVSIEIVSVNDAPVAVDDSYITPAGVTLIASTPEDGLLANDTDIEGNDLRLLTDQFVGPENGILTAAENGGIAYIPNAGFVGVDTFTYLIADATSVSNRGTVTIQVTTSDVPVGVADSFEVDMDQTLTVPASGVLSNDSDPNGDPLSAALVTQPANGTATLSENGALQYTPDAGFVGVDTFIYVAFDGTTSSSPVTVTISVVDDSMTTTPIADDDEYTVNEDAVLTVDAPGVLANDSDFDGSPLSAVLVTGPSNGTLELNGDGSFVYTPNPDFEGPTDSFTYAADDGGRSDEANVTINIESHLDAPVTVDDEYIVEFETPLTVSAANGVLANDSDVDTAEITSVLLAEPTNGSVVLELDGSFTYTPDDDFIGSDTFTYGAQDGFLTTFGFVTLDVQPPVTTGDLVSFRVAVTNSNGAELTELDTGDSFEVRVYVDDISSQPQQGVFAAYTDVSWPASLAIATGEIEFGGIYNNGISGDTLTRGLINEAGAFDGLDALGGAEQLLFKVPMLATGAGDLTFTANPAELSPFGDVLLYVTRDERVPVDRIDYGSTTVSVAGLSRPAASNDEYETNTGSLVVSADDGVLRNDLASTAGSLTATIATQAVNGTVSLNADGSFTYIADAGFVGNDSFTYQAVSGGVESNLATVTVFVGNPDPSSIGGVIYFDTNNNAVREAGEHGFGGVDVTLTGTTIFGESVQRATKTNASGAYSFGQLAAGDYVVAQSQPAVVVDGIDTNDGQVSSTNNSFSIDLDPDTNLSAVNFAERGLAPGYFGNMLFMSNRIIGGAGIGINPDGSTSWYCLDSGWGTMSSVQASVSADGSSVTVTAVSQSGEVLATTVPETDLNVTILGSQDRGYFVRLSGPSSAYALQSLGNPAGEAVDAVFAE